MVSITHMRAACQSRRSSQAIACSHMAIKQNLAVANKLRNKALVTWSGIFPPADVAFGCRQRQTHTHAITAPKIVDCFGTSVLRPFWYNLHK